MELTDYLRTLRKGWWWVAVALAVGLAGAATLNTTMTPRYASTVTFFVTTPSRGVSDAYQGGLFSTDRVKSYAEVLTSDRLAQSIIKAQKLDLSVPEVRSRITARAIPDSVLLRATVTDTSRSRSLRIAQSLAPTFVAVVQSLETPPGGGTPAVKVEVIEGPELIERPVSPRPLLNLILGAVLGVLVGTAIAIINDIMDTTVRSTESLERLGVGPHLASVCVDRRARRAPLVGQDSGRSPRAEALRRVRTNLRFVDVDKAVRVMTVTSAVAAEGKSSIAANLAVVFAEAETSVVLVDADLRRPRVAEIFDIEGAVGLTNVLAGQVGLDVALQPTGAAQLWVLPSGTTPPNPSELLGSRAMGELLGKLRDRFDVVIVDTPPLLPVTDAAVVAVHADGAILVVRHGRTGAGQVRAAQQALRAVEARMLGYVLNMTPAKGSSRYDYYYRDDIGGRRPGKKAAPVQASERVLTSTRVSQAGGTGGPSPANVNLDGPDGL